MCFNPEMSLILTALGLVVAFGLHRKFGLWRVTSGVLYFCLMEALQAWQYQYVDDGCSTFNKVLTVVGIVHVLFQPFFIHLMGSAFAKTDADKARSDIYLKFALFAGMSLGASALYAGYFESASYSALEAQCLSNPLVNRDWLRGTDLCTRRGNLHLAWHVPMTAPWYLTPSSFIHAVAMFFPYFVQTKTMFNGVVFIVSGPILSALITGNVNEQASVWCFYSIIQICLITGRLLLPKKLRKGDEVAAGKKKKH